VLEKERKMETTELKDYGMDYELSESERAEVRGQFPKTYFPEPVLEPVYFGRRDKVRIPGKKAIVDQKFDGDFARVYGICSDAYKIIRYEDIIHMVQNSVGALTDFGKIQICPHTYVDGGRMYIV
jgi:hypothetical protein